MKDGEVDRKADRETIISNVLWGLARIEEYRESFQRMKSDAPVYQRPEKLLVALFIVLGHLMVVILSNYKTNNLIKLLLILLSLLVFLLFELLLFS